MLRGVGNKVWGTKQRDLYLRLKQQGAMVECGVSGVEMQAEGGIDCTG